MTVSDRTAFLAQFCPATDSFPYAPPFAVERVSDVRSLLNGGLSGNELLAGGNRTACHAYLHGIDVPRKKLLSPADIRQIRRRRYFGELLRKIAADYPVSVSMISEIVHRRAYREVQP